MTHFIQRVFAGRSFYRSLVTAASGASRRDLAGNLIDRAALNKVVNAEAREEVINNRSPNFTGCSVTEHPTCGRSFIHGKPVPFSEVNGTLLSSIDFIIHVRIISVENKRRFL